MGQPSVDTIWDWLDQVPDPEIPVISLVDLGIIRDVKWEGDTLNRCRHPHLFRLSGHVRDQFRYRNRVARPRD